MKCESLQAHDEHLRLVAEKEVHLLVHKSAKDEAEKEMKILREEHHKLEETTEAIKVIEEQLNDVRALDMHHLQMAVLELDRAKKELEDFVEEEASIRASVDSIKLELEGIKRERTECESKVLDKESRIEQLQVGFKIKKSSYSILKSVTNKLEHTFIPGEVDKYKISNKLEHTYISGEVDK